jgi:hypothetical protein
MLNTPNLVNAKDETPKVKFLFDKTVEPDAAGNEQAL